MKSVSIAYREILGKIINRNSTTEDENTVSAYDNDLTAAVRLLESGYDVDNTITALKQCSPMIKLLPTAKAVDIYVDKVLENVNKVWLQRADNVFTKAQEAYNHRIDNLMSKYTSYEKSKVGLYQDGEIALALVIKDGYDLGLIDKVIQKNTPNKKADNEYFIKLKKCIAKTQKRYKEIEDYIGKLDTPADVYRKCANEYLKKTGTLILNAADEQKIIEKMYDSIINKLKLHKPQFAGNSDRLDLLIDSQIKPFLRQAIAEASPVYTEPGRDCEQYVTSVIAEFENNCKSALIQSSIYYPATLKSYLKKINIYNEKITAYISQHDEAFKDSLVAKELLEEHHAPVNIIRAIVENISDKTRENIDKYQYAKEIISYAQDCLHSEKEIANLESRPELLQQKTIVETGLTLKQVFQYMMKERLDAYPSFALEMTEPFADRDAVEKLICRYHGFDKSELKRAIIEASPRAKLPSINKDNYAEQIIKEAEERLKKIDKKQQYNAAMQQKFNTLRGLASEGVYENLNPMSSFKDGRIAIKMLRQKMDYSDIHKFLIKLADVEKVTSAADYATEILTAAKLVLNKEDAISNYHQAAGINNTCKDIYMKKMNCKYKSKGFIEPTMDIQTMSEILAETNFSANEVKQVILDNSPIAKEPGRDAGYAEYVTNQVQLEKKQQEEKINRYIITPRLFIESFNKNSACEEEYNYQRKKMIAELKINWLPAMDVMLVSALLTAGYSKNELKRTLNTNKPNSWSSDISYGDKILNTVNQKIKNNVIEEVQNISRIRVPSVADDTISE